MARGSQATRPAQPRGRPAPEGGRGARGGALAQTLRSSAPPRYLIAHPGAAAALLFGLFVLVYLWPALVRGELLSPTSLLYGRTPWTPFVPEDVGGYLNGLLSDVPTADYPWRFLVRRMLHEGTFPSWNPYVLGGIPLWSNPQTGLFSIFSLPLWILPLNYGIGVGAALKLWAAGFGTWLLARELRLGFLPGLLAGVCFSFSAIDIVWLTHETLPAVAALLPWMLWLVERIYRGGRIGALLGLALATAIGLGGGHPGMQVHLVFAVGMYALLRAAFLSGAVTLRERLRPFGLAVGGLVLGILLMSFMLLPELLSTHGTVGTAARAHGRGSLPGTQMPFSAIRTVVFPDWWGRPSGYEAGGPVSTIAGHAIPLNYNERTFYTGAVGLLLALVGVVGGGGAGRWRRMGPFVVLAVLGLAIPLHVPGLWQLITHLPLFEQVQNQRLHFVWAMGVSVLAAFGLQALLERPAGGWRGVGVVVAVAALVGVLGLVVALSRGGALGDTLTHFVTGKTFESDAVVALTSVVWFLLFAVGVGVALWAARRWPRRRAWVGAGVVLLAAVDMLHFAVGYQPMAPASKSIPPRTDAIAFLQLHRDEGRIVGLGEAMPNDWGLTYGLRDVRGYDPPQPLKRYLRLWQAAEPQQIDWASFAVRALSPTALQVASVLGARYVVGPPGTQLGGGGPGEGPRVRGLRVAYDGIDARVWRNARAAPRVLVASRVRVVDGERGALAAVTEAGFDPRRDAVVEGGSGGADAGAAAGARGSTGTVSVSDPSPSRVLLRARLARPGLVVLNDAWAPGWSVTVDGRDADAVRVNDVMRGVAVGTGAHVVEWRYRVPGLRAGAVLSLLGVVVALGLLVWRRRRAPHPSDPSRIMSS